MGKRFIIEEVTEGSDGGCLSFVFWLIIILVAIKMCAN
jgi:hypothetical protein